MDPPLGSSSPTPLLTNPPCATLQDSQQTPSSVLDLPRTPSGNILDDARDLRGYRCSRKEPAAHYRSTGGQQFRVANIGQNGALYLRPVSRQVQPFPTPPMTPPPIEDRTLVFDVLKPRKGDAHESSEHPLESRWSAHLDQDHTHKRIKKSRSHLPVEPPTSALRARAHTFSTVETNAQLTNVDRTPLDAVKPPQHLKNDRAHLLEVSIPHPRLGTPYFSVNGSAILQTSVYTASSTSIGQSEYTRSNTDMKSPTSSLPRKFGSPTQPSPDMRRKDGHGLPRKSRTLRGLVQISPTTGKILGATPRGLIAQITSPSSLDYELLSDFFLTFRSYMRPADLVDHLITRLRWAFMRTDDFGSVVRVRTFVALRHWILNYFVDDFACDYSIRRHFCKLVNELCYDLHTDVDRGSGNLKVMGELKKCWRRTCALYWDLPNLKSEDAADDLLPGGLLGSRNASVDGSCSQTQQQRTSSMGRKLDAGSFGRLKGTEYSRENTAVTPPPDEHLAANSLPRDFNAVLSRYSGNSSAESDDNTNDAWCSVPGRRQKQRMKQPRRYASTTKIQYPELPASADIHGFKHLDKPSVGSFDAPRDSNVDLPTLNSTNPNATGSMALPFPGSLIRGVTVHPRSPYLRDMHPIKAMQVDNRPTVETTHDEDAIMDSSKPSIGHNPGVRKLFRPMRRALSTRRNIGPAYYGDGRPRPARPPSEFADYQASQRPSFDPHPITTTTIGETQAKNHSLMRIDLLAATISESFKEAVREETAAQITKDFAAKRVAADAIGPKNPSLDPLKSNPVMNEGGIIGITEAADRPAKIDLEGEEKLPSGQRRTQKVDTQGEEDSMDHNARMDEKNSQTVKSSPTIPFRRLSTSMLDTMAGALELGDSHFIVQQSAQKFPPNHNSNARPELSKAFHLFDEQERLPHHQTVESANAASTSTDPTATSTNDPFYMDRLPRRQIRRQPGGDLRAVDHVHSLLGLGTTQSIGSGSEASPHVSQYLDNYVETASINSALNPVSPHGSIQILPTPPLPPLGRNSFELEVAKLAQLPDDEYDDGSRESALRKLEGLEEEQTLTHHARTNSSTAVPDFDGQLLLQDDAQDGHPYQKSSDKSVEKVTKEPLRTETPIQLDPILTSQGVLYPSESILGQAGDIERHSIADTEDSYSSTPLMERGLSQPMMARKNSSSDWLAVSLPDAASQESVPTPTRGPGREVEQSNQSTSSPITSDVKSKKGLQTESSFVSDTHRSFLLDDDQSLRSLSTITQEEHLVDEQASSGMRSFYDDDVENASNFRISDILPHPLRHPSRPVVASTPIPEESPQKSSPTEPLRHIPLQERVDFHAKAAANAMASRNGGLMKENQTSDDIAKPATPSTAHYPFILCHDALTLAQQLTLIERDALSEIDWRELIDLRWRQSPNDTRNWVDYLKAGNKDADDQAIRGGVDICITRFNIMVKWAVSEIVLTEDLTERVACIVKYIQIAQYSRRLRNWATMFQITMALVSADVSRLKQTWSFVPEKEKAALKTIEALIMPTRNFANLRAEMEDAVNKPITEADAAIGATGGSIPFIGLYTHDLIYNAQKPEFIKRTPSVERVGGRNSVERGGALGHERKATRGINGQGGVGHGADELAEGQGGEGEHEQEDEDEDEDGEGEGEQQLVNFERLCAAAAIVKSLLRTVEASARYAFAARPEVLSFCLWMAALGDEEIERRGRGLE